MGQEMCRMGEWSGRHRVLGPRCQVSGPRETGISGMGTSHGRMGIHGVPMDPVITRHPGCADTWDLRPDTGHLAPGTWHPTPDTWDLTPETGGHRHIGGSGASRVPLPSRSRVIRLTFGCQMPIYIVKYVLFKPGIHGTIRARCGRSVSLDTENTALAPSGARVESLV